MDLWAFVPRVGRWVLLIPDLDARAALDEKLLRQDRVRRSGLDCKFALLPVGEGPPPRPTVT